MDLSASLRRATIGSIKPAVKSLRTSGSEITFDVGDVRPFALIEGGPIYLLLIGDHGDSLNVSWSATFHGIDGQLTGALDLPLKPEPESCATLLNPNPVRRPR
jgi:hypothetical protein